MELDRHQWSSFLETEATCEFLADFEYLEQ